MSRNWKILWLAQVTLVSFTWAWAQAWKRPTCLSNFDDFSSAPLQSCRIVCYGNTNRLCCRMIFHQMSKLRDGCLSKVNIALHLCNCIIISVQRVFCIIHTLDILGHKKLKAFITHGGLLSMYETVYHGAPAVVMPVFCDHDVNSEKSMTDGYGERGDKHDLMSQLLFSTSFHSLQAPFGNIDIGKTVQSCSCGDSWSKIPTWSKVRKFEFIEKCFWF